MSEGGPEVRSATPLDPTPPPVARALASSPSQGQGLVAGGEAADADLHRADPLTRRKLLLIAPPGIGLLLGMAWWYHGYLDTLPVESSQQMIASTRDVFEQLERVLCGSALLLALLAVYWFRLARTVALAAQYPLPQMRLFHDMRILRGAAKDAYARRARYSGAGAALLAMLLLGAALLLAVRGASQHPLLFNPEAPAAGAGHGS